MVNLSTFTNISLKQLLTILLTTFLVVAALTTKGQSFNINLSSRHVEQIEKLKSPAKKLKKYKKYFSKDSVRFIRTWEKRLRKKPDSILVATQASLRESEQRVVRAEDGLRNKLNGILSDRQLQQVGVNSQE